MIKNSPSFFFHLRHHISYAINDHFADTVTNADTLLRATVERTMHSNVLLSPRHIRDRERIFCSAAFGISCRQMEAIFVDPGRGFTLLCMLKAHPR